MAYKQRLTLLHSYIHTTETKVKTTKPSKKKHIAKCDDIQSDKYDVSIAKIAKKAKSDNTDIIALLREHIVIEEICI